MGETCSQGRAIDLVVGLGSSRGVHASAVWSALRLAVPDLTAITAFATVDRRRDEPGLRCVIREHGAPLYCYPAAELDAVDVPYPSESVRGHVGTRSVAEAAALLAARELGGGSLVVPKQRGEHVTVAVAALDLLSISSMCTACGACLRTCPERALRPAPLRPMVVGSRCTSCGECVEICPTDAITLRDERDRSRAQ
ncbi:MAG TPA: cobalamin biosynthesis protein [Pseudonocardiaceae bacterium]|jgi:ferredoxin|nr:cobalamin biosynthesis protein [Pseudonocardiaceae bacterium]